MLATHCLFSGVVFLRSLYSTRFYYGLVRLMFLGDDDSLGLGMGGTIKEFTALGCIPVLLSI